MIEPASGKLLTPRAIANWTAVISALLVVWMAVFVSNVTLIGRGPFMVLFTPTFFIGLALGWTGRVDRILPAVFATVLVGMWPLYRWSSGGDVRSGKEFLFIAGTINVLVVMCIALDFGKRRGWVVMSPRRTKLLAVAVCIHALSRVIGWPTGIWQSGLSWTWTALLLWSMFWPLRQKATSSAAPGTV